MENIFKSKKQETAITKLIDNKISSMLFEDPSEKDKKIKLIIQTGNFDASKSQPPWYILLPDQKSKQLWDLFITFWIIFSLIITPVNIGWNLECITSNEGKTFSTLNTAMTVFFFLDIVLNCITGYMDDRRTYIFEIDKIFQNYLRKYLLIDVMSSIPFDKIFTFDMNDCYKPNIASSKYAQILFFLRGLKLNKYFEIIERLFSKFALQIRFAKLFIFIFYLAHLIGNVYTGISPGIEPFIFHTCQIYSESDPKKIECIAHILKTNFSGVYFYSMFVGLSMMFGADYDIKYNWERMIQFLTIIFSTIITATIYSNVTIMLIKLSSGISPVLQEKIDKMNQYMQFMKFEEKFQKQIEEYHINIWYKQRNIIYEDNFLSDMSEPLQKSLLLHQWKYSFFAENKFFKKISSLFITDIVIFLKPKIFMKSDVIFSEGETGTDLFFISKTGKCKVTIGGQWVRNLSFGDYFGEIGVFLRSRRRTATIVSIQDADFLYLEGKSFEFFLRNYPEDYENIRNSAIKVLMNSIKLYNASLFSKLVPSNHLKDYLFRKNIYLEDEDEDRFFSELDAANSNTLDAKTFNNKVEAILDELENSIKKIKI